MHVNLITPVCAAHMRRPRSIFMMSIAVSAVAMLAFPTSANAARLVWNFSPSAPAGLYYIEHGAWRVGDRVAVWPSPELAGMLDRLGVLKRGRLLIKTVAAIEGDRVCRAGGTITLNGHEATTARIATSTGEILPSWDGCQTLTASEVFLLGETEGSFDGRYFGITSTRDIIGPVRLTVRVR